MNCWDQRSSALPPDVKKIVDDYLADPQRKVELKEALETVRIFLARTEEGVGVLVALAEVEDRELRICLAKALRDTVGKRPSVG